MTNRFSPDVILRSRVRLARNIVDYPFPPVLDNACRQEIVAKVSSALATSNFNANTDIADPIRAHILAEDHLISREFAAEKEAHALFLSHDRASKPLQTDLRFRKQNTKRQKQSAY